MHNLFNNRVLKLIPILFLILIFIKILYTYNDLKNKEYDFAKKEAEVLNSYAMTNRTYYQNLFINGTLKLNPQTLQALPAYSSTIISNKFSTDNPLNITIKSVSDRARNPNNAANKAELKAIEFFKNNKNKKEYFSDENSDYYQYANVLRINNVCLKCHGKRENAPKFIRETYEDAYDYKLGEIRGIISIKIPTKNLNSYFFNNFIKSIFYDFLLLLLLFVAVNYLLKKSRKINKVLTQKVQEKTKELNNLLLFDRLTLLPNRLKLMQDIMIQKEYTSIHLALINIDRFKDINDLYGYETGDKIIKELAYKIKELCTTFATVYKLPTDEYAIFTTTKTTQAQFLQKLEYVIKEVQESKFKAEENSIFITLSCGTVSNQTDLMTKADVALQIAKKDKRNIVTYDSSINTKEKIIQNMQAISLLKKAIEKDLITPFFQPIYNTHTKKIEKYESLARIVLEDGEVIAPFVFLDIAIKSKLYPEITKAMIEKSFSFFKDKDYEFSINLSIHDIQNANTLQFLTDSLEKFTQPQNVIFEILESDKIDNYEDLKKFIKTVKNYGCKVAIDDFGSGYSNFSHIFELNVDYLKIDSSLVKFITTDENSRVIVKTIINFASNLGLKTIAEFVEDEDSLKMLEKMGVDFIQGYYIGKPNPKLDNNFEV